MKKNESKKSVVNNYIYNLIYEVVALAAPLILVPYVARVLSVESVGLYSYTYSIILYFAVFVSLGTKSYAIKKIAQSLDAYQKSKIFYEVFSLRFIMGITTLCIYFIFMYVTSMNMLIASIQSIYILARMFDISWFFQGVENFKTIVFRNIVFKVLTVICVLLFVKNDSQLPLYILLLSGLTLMGNLALFPYLKNYLVKVKLRDIHLFHGFSEIMVLFIPTISSQIYAALDKTMLGVICENLEQNAYYEQAQKIIGVVLTVVTSVGVVMLPRIAKLQTRDQSAMISVTEQSYGFISMLAIPMIVGISSVADIFIPWFLGEEYNQVIFLITIMSPIFLIVGISNITGFQYLVATNRQGIYSFSIALGTVINGIVNSFMIRPWGAVGAAISTVAAESVIALVQVVYVFAIKKELSLRNCFSQIGKHILSASVMGMIIWRLKPRAGTGLISTVVLVAAGISVYVICLLILKERLLIKFIHGRKKDCE